MRPGGRTHLGVKVPYTPGKGSVSRTARASAVRRSLKEAARAKRWIDEQEHHKKTDEAANIVKVQNLYGSFRHIDPSLLQAAGYCRLTLSTCAASDAIFRLEL